MSRTLLLLSLVLTCACAARPARSQEPVSSSTPERDVNIERACQVIDPSVLPPCQHDAEDRRPPSRLFEAAIETYAWRDYKQAMNLFTDVIGGKGNDDGCGVQRAVYYRAKTLYRLGLYNESFGDFVRFIQVGPSGAYYFATARWIVSLRDKLPSASLNTCLDRYRSMCPLM